MGSRKGEEKIDPNYKQVQQAFRPNMARKDDQPPVLNNYKFKAPGHIQVPSSGKASFSMDVGKSSKYGESSKK